MQCMHRRNLLKISKRQDSMNITVLLKKQRTPRIANRTWWAPMEWEIDGLMEDLSFSENFLLVHHGLSVSTILNQLGKINFLSIWGFIVFGEDSNRKSRKFIPLDMVDSITYMQYLDFKPTSIGKWRVLVRLYFDKDRKQFSEKWYDYNMFKMSLTK